MKQSNTFDYELNEQSEDHEKSDPGEKSEDHCSPRKHVISNLLSYAKALEVMKNKSGNVYLNIIN